MLYKINTRLKIFIKDKTEPLDINQSNIIGKYKEPSTPPTITIKI